MLAGSSLLLTLRQYIKAMRLFKDEPKWTPLNRGNETDANEHRETYLRTRDGKAPVEELGSMT